MSEPSFPLPDYMEDIYTRPKGWEDFSVGVGYKKRPCMIRLESGEEHGPCWPNAGKFKHQETGQEWFEVGVAAVAYYEPVK